MKCISYKHFFEVFANDTRLKIIESLEEDGLCVNDISEVTGEEQSKISHNLKVLEQCNFVDCHPDGKKRIYSLNRSTIKPLMKLVQVHVKDHCKGCWVKK